MDLAYTPEQDAFRAEVRARMQANVPAAPLATLESREGYDQHLAWERRLADGDWGMVTWPREYGGRSWIRWLIFEEEYYRAGAPLRANQNAMATAGVERGLTLRSPARFRAAAARLVSLHRAFFLGPDMTFERELSRG